MKASWKTHVGTIFRANGSRMPIVFEKHPCFFDFHEFERIGSRSSRINFFYDVRMANLELRGIRRTKNGSSSWKKKKKRNKKKSLDRLIVLFCGIFNEGILRCGTVTDFIQASYGPIRVCVCIWPICVCGLRSCTRGRTSKLDDRSVADVDIDITAWPERLISPCHCFRWSVLPRHDRG